MHLFRIMSCKLFETINTIINAICTGYQKLNLVLCLGEGMLDFLIGFGSGRRGGGNVSVQSLSVIDPVSEF